MSVVAFVLLLSIPVAMVARRAPATAVLVALWAFFMSFTPLSAPIHSSALTAGRAILHVFGGV